jgi:hypothetical protein
MNYRLILKNQIEQGQQTFRAYITNKPEILVFIATFIFLLWSNLTKGNFTFYLDAGTYWDLRYQFNREETVRFSLINYNEPFRGYLFPLINYLIYELADRIGLVDVVLLEVFQAFVYSLLICIIIPRGIHVLFHHKPTFWQVSVFTFLVIFFWQSYFFYPLSDFLAVLLFLSGAYLFVRYYSYWLAAISVGMAWGGATLVRPAYQITLVPLIVWVLYFCVKKIHLDIFPTLVRLLGILTGMAIIFAPQVSINLTHFGIPSYMPQTQLTYGEDLFTQQLSWGIVLQKYEGNIGTNYPTNRVHFLDRQGENILIEAGFKSKPYLGSGEILPDRPLTLTEYVGLLLKYPLDFISIYTRHLFNGLDIIYNTVYIEDVYQRSILLRLINYSLWFLVFVYISSKRKAVGQHISQLFLPAIFALPSVLSIPTAIEIRFMLPIHLMAYALAAFWILPDFVERDFSEKRIIVFNYITWYFVFLLLCFMLSANTYMNLEYGNYLLTGK